MSVFPPVRSPVRGPLDGRAIELSGYALMRSLKPNASEPFAHSTGDFTATTTTAVDNGGTVIASATPGVMWVRNGVYNTAGAPMRLSWFEASPGGALLKAGRNATTAIARICKAATTPLDADYDRYTVGLWRFNGNLSAEAPPSSMNATIYLDADIQVSVSQIDVPFGVQTLHLTGDAVLAATNEMAVRITQMHGSETDVVLGDGVFIPAGRAFGVEGDPAQCSLTIAGSTQPLSRFVYVDPIAASAGNYGDVPVRPVNSVAEGVALATPGTTVWFADGVYQDRLVITRSGESGAPITFRARNRLGAWFRGLHAASTSGIIEINQQNFIVIQGLRVGQAGWSDLFNPPANVDWATLRAWGCSNIRVEDCAFLYFGRTDQVLSNAAWRFSDGGGNECTNIVLRANTIRYGVAFDPHQINVDGPHILEGNAAGEGIHTVAQVQYLGAAADPRPVRRGNVSVNMFGRPGWDNTHENNALNETGTFTGSFNSGRSASGASKMIGNAVIYRNNQALRLWDRAWETRPYNAYMSTIGQRWYHNTFRDIAGAAISIGTWESAGATFDRYQDNYYLNNLFVNIDQVRSGQAFYASDASVASYEVGKAQHRVEVSAIFGDTVSPAIYGPLETATPVAFPDFPLSEYSLLNTLDTVGLWQFNGDIVSAQAANIIGVSEVPLANAGLALARATSTGSGTIIPVTDAGMFHEGVGTVFDHTDRGDLIVVNGQARRVVGRDLVAKTITVDASVSWTVGEAVSLYWAGGRDIGPHLPVRIAASHTTCPPGTTVNFSLSAVAPGWEPKFAEWWLGDTVKKTGLLVSEMFDGEPIHPVNYNETHHPIRARVYCTNGEVLWLSTVVTTIAPKPGGKLLSFQLENNQDYWFTYFQTYRGDPVESNVESLTHDTKLDRNVFHVPILSGGQGTLMMFPQDWDTDVHPILWFRYRIKAGVPMFLQLLTWQKPDMQYPDPPTLKTASSTQTAPTLLIDDDEWHEIAVDVRDHIASWPTAGRNLRGFRMRRDTPAPDNTEYYALAGLEIRQS